MTATYLLHRLLIAPAALAQAEAEEPQRSHLGPALSLARFFSSELGVNDVCLMAPGVDACFVQGPGDGALSLSLLSGSAWALCLCKQTVPQMDKPVAADKSVD